MIRSCQERRLLFSMKPDGSDVRARTRFRTVCTYGSFSPDIKQIVYRRVIDGPAFQWDLNTFGRNEEVFVANCGGSNELPLLKNAAFDGWPAWSPDERIAFSSKRAGPANRPNLCGQRGRLGLRQITGGRLDRSTILGVTDGGSSCTAGSRRDSGNISVVRSTETQDLEGVLGVFRPDNCCIETSFRLQPVLSSSLLCLDPS